MLSHDFDGMFDLFTIFESDCFFNDAETAKSNKTTDNIGADFLTFIIW